MNEEYNIKSFINLDKKCIFCQSKLKYSINHYFGINIYFNYNEITGCLLISSKYYEVYIDTNNNVNILRNIQTLDDTDYLNRLRDCYIHIRLSCNKCENKYYIESTPLLFTNNKLDKLKIIFQCFKYKTYRVCSDFLHKQTNIYNTDYIKYKPIIIPTVIDFTNKIHLLPTIITFS